jgi:N-ethylmaleimide reductase
VNSKVQITSKMISYSTSFLANPDLLERFELDIELKEVDRATMHVGHVKGYIDEPFLNN